jgi:hypothetical protein
MDSFGSIVADARAESPLWGAALRPAEEREPLAVFSTLAPAAFAIGLETVYEAYLVHYGKPRLFASGEESERVLLGDYLYAHGLVRISEAGGVGAVAAMAELISSCASLRASGEAGDGEAWVSAARSLGGDPSNDDVAVALERHSARIEPSSLQGAGTIPQ